MDSIKFIKTNSEQWKTINQDDQLNNIIFIEDIKLLWTNGVYYGSETNKIKTVTVNELQDLKTTNSLIPGQIYEITDFRTTLDRSIGEVVYKDDETHHIQVVALTTDTLAEDAKSILVVPVVVSSYFPPTGDFELIAYKCDWDPDNSIYTEDGEYYKYIGETIEIDGTTYYIWNKYENGVRLSHYYGKSRVLTDTLDINCSIDNPYHIEYYISYEDEINPDYEFMQPTEENNDPPITDSFSRITRIDKPVYNYNIKMLACDMNPDTGKYELDEDSWYEYNGDTMEIEGVTYFIWNKYDGDSGDSIYCGLPLTTSLDIQCSPSMPYAPEYWLSLDTGELDDEYFDPEKTDIFYQIEYSNLPKPLEETKLVFVETSVKFNLPEKSNFDESQIVNALAFKTKLADGSSPSDIYTEPDYESMFLYNGGTFDLDGKTYYIWDKWIGGVGELINGQYAIDEYGMYPQKLLTDKLYIECSLNRPYTADYSLTQDGETEDNYQFNHFGDSFVEIKYFNSTTNYIRFVNNGWYVRCPELDQDGKFGWAYIDNLVHTSDNSYEWAEGGGNGFGPFPAFMNTYNLNENDFFLTDTLDPQVGDSFRIRGEEGEDLDTIDKVWGTIIEPTLSSDEIYHTRTEFGDGIYYMKDEFGNEAPYDFKHIKFNGVYTFGTSNEDYSLDGFTNKVYNNKIMKPINGLFNRINISSKNTYANVFYPSCVDYTFDSPIKESLIRISENGALMVGANSMVENVTWAELKYLRDNAQLAAGKQYRIIDYVATTVQEETTSAEHPFDIIVTADDERTLNENARAILHDGDEYFANCNLAAWELKYCLDNDAKRFAWAYDDGKGVVYYMKDEWNNECPYDFKGIMFVRYGITNLWSNDLNKVSEDLVESLRVAFCFDRNNGLPMAYDYNDFSIPNVDAEISGSYWCYTFNAKNLDDGLFYDASVICNKEGIDEYTNVCENNVIKSYHDEYLGRQFLYRLNNIVFNNYFSITDGNYLVCSSNTFGNSCHSNTFGKYCYFNTFGEGCHSNIFGESCNSNTFGIYCHDNTFGNICHYNTFGHTCYDNTFGESCHDNIFGGDCYYNNFGYNFCNNTFGNFCRYNTFGNSCGFNTFSNYCFYTKCSDHSTNTTIENDAVQGSSSNKINLSELFPQIVQTTTPYKTYRIGLNSNGELVCINNYDVVSVDTSEIENVISDIESNVSTLQDNVTGIESNISENEEVIAAVFDKTRQTIGADENIKVTFSGTNNLDGCKSLLEAILLLDAKLKNE